jgi:hypothetical protein
MKVLVLIVSNQMDIRYLENINILNNFMNKDNNIVDYAGISSYDDFKNYEEFISFKYKVVDDNLQLTKVCNFIKTNKEILKYDWYIKYRPELKLLHKVDFEHLCEKSINCRVFSYEGPKKILFGSSWEDHINISVFSKTEKKIIVDDQLYIFHNTLIDNNIFNKDNFIDNTVYEGNEKTENEITHTLFWIDRNIKINIISLDMIFTKSGRRSGHINII